MSPLRISPPILSHLEHLFLMEILLLAFDMQIQAQVSIHQVLQERYMRGIAYEAFGRP